jgi:hypothetical protein
MNSKHGCIGDGKLYIHYSALGRQVIDRNSSTAASKCYSI